MLHEIEEGGDIRREALLKIIKAHEYILQEDSVAKFISLNKERDEVVVELNVLLASPMVDEKGEVVDPCRQKLRHALRLRLRLSDLFFLGQDAQPPERDLIYTFERLDEALKHECAHAPAQHDQECDLVAGLSVELGIMQQRVKDFEDDYKLVMEEKCGDDKLHCTCVPSLRAAIKEAREEVFDLYHQACLVHPNSSDDPIREFQYDNMCMSTYESIEDKLIEWGLLKEEQCLRRKK